MSEKKFAIRWEFQIVSNKYSGQELRMALLSANTRIVGDVFALLVDHLSDELDGNLGEDFNVHFVQLF